MTAKATAETGVVPVVDGQKLSLDDLRNARNRNAAEVRSLAAILQTTRGADGKRAGSTDSSSGDRSLGGSERRESNTSALDVSALPAEGGPSHVRGVCEFLVDNSHVDDSLGAESWISAASNEMSMMG